MRYLLLFFWCAMGLAQPITITIDAVTATDSTRQRQFKINFTIKNNSQQRVSFFLDPQKFNAANGGSMQNAVFYKIYEEKESIDASSILTTRILNDITFPDFTKMSKDSIQKFADQYRIDYMEKEKINLYTSIIRLKPGESRSFSKEMHWNFERYHSYADNEYYIDGKKQHFLELILIVLLEEYESKLTGEQYAAIKSDMTMIKGWFASNRYKIDFSE